jgi:site-specific DNA-cytosine methylase
MPEGWGFTKRPAPTVRGKIAYTRGASGTKAIVGEAIELGVFLPKNGFAVSDMKLTDRDDTRYGVAFAKRYNAAAINVNVFDSLILQGYPSCVVACGSKMEQELQIGNAVPPPLAETVLKELWT